jgi:uncharacterized LabA/DUF88 family protein
VTNRVMVFVDYWNFQLGLNDRHAKKAGVKEYRFRLDWVALGPHLAREASQLLGDGGHSYDGMYVYTSYAPGTEEGKKFQNWVTSFLERQPGIKVDCRERRPKFAPKCPACHAVIETCPKCNERIKATVEKGVDTQIVTDMIRLAWEGAYDVAVLATLDADLVPAVEFLRAKGRKVVQAGFPPRGAALSRACYASLDAAKSCESLRRS